MNITLPGFNTKEDHNSAWPAMSRQILDFIPHKTGVELLDVGEKGYKAEQLATIFKVYQLEGMDFNYPGEITDDKRYPVIICFEVMEHLQNPLLFFYRLTQRLEKGG